MKIPKTVYTLKNTIIFTVGLALFVLLFSITYNPTYGMGDDPEASGMTRLLQLWHLHQGMCLPICCAIILVSTALSRIALLLTTHTARIRESEYLLWQLVEVVVTALFCNLFISLYLHVDFIEHIPSVLLVYTSVAIYPYALFWLYVERLDRDLRIATAQRTIEELRQGSSQGQSGMLRFVDDKGNVKLVVSTERVIAIEAAGNYANILYENNNRLSRFSLRNTLKGIEELCESNALVRCHRSYYINLHKVKLLRKEADGIYAEIDVAGVDDIPVSKSYASEVMQRFSEIAQQ